MVKSARFAMAPVTAKRYTEIDEHGKLREPFVRLPAEPDHWTFYLNERAENNRSRHAVADLGAECSYKNPSFVRDCLDFGFSHLSIMRCA